MEFRLKLRQFREKAGLSQKEIAEIAGVDIKTAGNWERGVTFPKADQLWEICMALNTDPNEILGWWDEHPRDDAPPLKPDESDIVGFYRESTPERKHSLMMTARDSAAMSKDAAERPAPDVREAV